SVPEKGVNPLESLARFILGLCDVEHPVDEVLGASSVAPTLLATDQESANVVPGEVWQTLDWRTVPGQQDEEVRRRLEEILAASLADGADGEVTVPVYTRRTYTGRTMEIPGSNPPYALADDHPAVVAAGGILTEIVGGEAATPGIWKFATDGGHFAEAGMAPVGIGPGDEFLAHTNVEQIEIEALDVALDINRALAERLGLRAAELGFEAERPESSRP
ncbi:MAG: M20/M25/M40 family metallo-hydrolase, partial [Thermoanaerobaculia bacterium]|nr:M20/M25/M40 family metallo-hydrolase [Thermoanaerobaculia bacterium]